MDAKRREMGSVVLFYREHSDQPRSDGASLLFDEQISDTVGGTGNHWCDEPDAQRPRGDQCHGGPELVVDQVACGLTAAGCEVALFTTGDATCPVERELDLRRPDELAQYLRRSWQGEGVGEGGRGWAGGGGRGWSRWAPRSS